MAARPVVGAARSSSRFARFFCRVRARVRKSMAVCVDVDYDIASIILRTNYAMLLVTSI